MTSCHLAKTFLHSAKYHIICQNVTWISWWCHVIWPKYDIIWQQHHIICQTVKSIIWWWWCHMIWQRHHMAFGKNVQIITSFAKPSNQLYDDDDVTWFGKDIIWHSVKTSKSSHHSTKLCDLLAKRSCNGKYDLIGLYYYQTLVHYKKKKVVS